jgi:hypothetical protein
MDDRLDENEMRVLAAKRTLVTRRVKKVPYWKTLFLDHMLGPKILSPT